MYRFTWCWTGLLICALSGMVAAQESLPTAVPVKPAPPVSQVDLEIRLVEIRENLKLPLAEIPAPPGPATSTATKSRVLTKEEMRPLFEVLQADRRTNILAAPRLRLNLGTKGEFRSGTEVVIDPAKPSAATDVPKVRTQFVGTAVDATVTAPKPGLMNIDLRFEQSSMAPAKKPAVGNAGINMVAVTTKMELKSGQTLMLRGLEANRTTMTETRIPVLGELPVVGSALFSRKRTDIEKGEMMVFVTAIAMDDAGNELR